MDTANWIEASFIALAALALSAVCIKHRIGGGEYLCSDCRYNASSLCNKAGRPTVDSCTSYRPGPVELDREEEKEEEEKEAKLADQVEEFKQSDKN